MKCNNNSRNLNAAKAAKDDEFYTPYDFIENELKHYREQFADKVVYCPCDNPRCSMFVKYFLDNFNLLHLSRLIATYYGSDDIHIWEANGAYRVDKAQPDKDGLFEAAEIGSYDSSSTRMLIEHSDIVVTNPPFSKFRDFFGQLLEMKKKFLIVGSNIATSKEVVANAWKEGKVWGGYNCEKSCWFGRPDGTTKAVAVTWYTNLIVDRVVEEYKSGTLINDLVNKNKWNTFDERPDVLNLEKVSDYPDEYTGLVAIPLNSFYRFSEKYFDFVGEPKCQLRAGGHIHGKKTAGRLIIKRKDGILIEDQIETTKQATECKPKLDAEP